MRGQRHREIVEYRGGFFFHLTRLTVPRVTSAVAEKVPAMLPTRWRYGWTSTWWSRTTKQNSNIARRRTRGSLTNVYNKISTRRRPISTPAQHRP